MDLRTRRVIYASAFLRAAATGMVGVLLALHLARLGMHEQQIGWISGLGLAGTAAAAAIATVRGQRIGPRRLLIVVEVLGGVGIVAVALGSSFTLLALVAFVGMVNSAGRDRGAALVLETAVLPKTTDDRGRTGVFARYNVLVDAGHAIGSLLAGALTPLQARVGEEAGMRGGVGACGALLFVAGAVTLALPRAFDRGERERAHAPVTPATRRMLVRICALFGLDSLGGGFLVATLVNLWFVERFGVDAGALAALNAGKGVLNALSHVGAAWLARRIGLVNTMVFTHLPSSLLLLTVPFAPTFPVAALLFLLREGLAEMDVPTRQSYVMAVVQPSERTFAAGVTTLVRMSAWAIGPAIAGYAMHHDWKSAPLYCGAVIKILYDLLLYRACRRVKPPEES